jgi:hypothetical protein
MRKHPDWEILVALELRNAEIEAEMRNWRDEPPSQNPDTMPVPSNFICECSLTVSGNGPSLISLSIARQSR